LLPAACYVSSSLSLTGKTCQFGQKLDIRSHTTLTQTLAYGENAPGSSQGELIPVYELKVRFVEKNTDAVTEDLIYLPAPSIGAPLRVFLMPRRMASRPRLYHLDRRRCGQNLESAGGGNFDFVMGYNGADGTYTYEWDLGSVVPENKIADLNPNDGATNVTFVAPQTDDDHGSVLDVPLVVKDINRPNADSAGTATATAQRNVVPPVFLPLITK